MRILNRDEFGKEPSGVLYFQVESEYQEEICVKYESIYHDGNFTDWTCAPLIKVNIDAVCMELPDNNVGRDGCFDQEALFFVLEDDDICDIIDKLGQFVKG